MGVQWNEAEPEVFVVPRIEDELIDDMFYQEDEIGEMRHTAFMIECGLEEDPPDGPDVPPIPWKPEDLKKAAKEAEDAKKKEETARPAPARRMPPSRTHSMDEGLEELEEHLPDAAKSPTRGVVATHSGGVLQNKRPPRRGGKSLPSRHMSVDAYGKHAKKPTLSLGLARTEKKKTPGAAPPRLSTTKSGSSLHTMRNSLRNLMEGVEEDVPPSPAQRSSPRRRASKLVATKSGNLHGMRQALQKPTVGDVKEEDDDEGSKDEYSEPLKREPVRGSLVVTKSGTAHGLRRPTRAERRDSKDSRSTMDASTSSGDSFLSEFSDSSSSDDSDVSIATDASDDEPKPKPTNPTEILKQIKADKERKKRREKRREEKRKAKKEKKLAEGGDDGEKKEKKSKKKKKFGVKKRNSLDVPPAFRHALK